jgi:hypothetical protein
MSGSLVLPGRRRAEPRLDDRAAKSYPSSTAARREAAKAPAARSSSGGSARSCPWGVAWPPEERPVSPRLQKRSPVAWLGDGRVLRCVNGLGGGQGWHAEQADGVR